VRPLPGSPHASTAIGLTQARPRPVDDLAIESVDELMARVADGDRSAFSLVYRRLWEPTLRLCVWLLHSEADAQDAAQQAMEKILARASDYDRTRPATAWALAIAAWECRTIIRRSVRHRETSDEAAVSALVAADLNEEVIGRDLAQAAVAALGTLDESDQEVLVETFWEEAKDAAPPALRKRRQRALARLRAAFRRLYGID
jgi:RNA polymerase sigma-70 factor (ECF subfamily)